MGIYKVHALLIEDDVLRFSYLLTSDEETVLIDPGSKYHVKKLIEGIEKYKKVKDIDVIILQSNDYLNITSVDALIEKGFKGKIIVHETGASYLNKIFKVSIKTLESLDYHFILKNGDRLDFYPLPFLPFAECFATYYKQKAILFSGHLGSQSADEEELIDSVNHFHEAVMPSVEFVRHGLNKVKKLKFDRLYPRLGETIEKSDFSAILKGVLTYDFYNTQQVVLKKNAKNVSYNYEMICNHMLRKLSMIYKSEEVHEVFNDSDIELDAFLHFEIAKTSLTGYKLWNGFFERIYHKKGISWLTFLEPLVKKYHRMYNIHLPTIYKSKMLAQSKKITTLSQQVDTLAKKLDETAETLLRCPITKLYNERFLMQYLMNNITLDLTKDHTRGLIGISVDNLHEINKKHGPDKGNETLRNVVHIIKRLVSEETLIFKKQGPGLFVYKHDIDPKQLVDISVKIRNAVNEADVFIEPIDISISIVELSEVEETESVSERAGLFVEFTKDRLEHAKRKGKNQILDKTSDENSYLEGSILLIDEDETNQNLMMRMFKRIHYEVLIARDVYEAYDIIETHSIDVVISEINLSKLDGFQLKQRLNQSQSYRVIPFIIISHHKNLDAVMRANLLDIDLILQKPIIPEELIGHVKRIRDKRVTV